MRTDIYGQQIYDEMELCLLYLQDPTRTMKRVLVNNPSKFDDVLELENRPDLIKYEPFNCSVNEFDKAMQSLWHMPEEYKQLDIAEYIVGLCKTQQELQRVGQELLLYQERNLFDLLRYLKYLVDLMRENRLIWGVGRGSSVASYVLYLLGVHRINSMYYELDPAEFLR